MAHSMRRARAVLSARSPRRIAACLALIVCAPSWVSGGSAFAQPARRPEANAQAPTPRPAAQPSGTAEESSRSLSPLNAQWHVRELKPTRAERVSLEGSWFVRGSDSVELARARALCEQAGQAGKRDCGPTRFAAETPARRVYVTRFEIDRHEVSHAQYLRCVSAGACLAARVGDDVPAQDTPVTRVTWREARDYCQFMGGDLPTEAQWEYAAHGDSRRTFPWGDEWRAEHVTHAGRRGEPSPVTAHPSGESFFGLLNMAGNVWELVLDRYVAPYSSQLPSVDPLQSASISGGGDERVIRGGSYLAPAHQLRARARASVLENEAREDVGFRCAYPASRPAHTEALLKRAH